MGLAAVAAMSLTAMAVFQGVVLKRAPKEGETIKYRMKAAMDVQGQSIEMNALMVEKVTAVKDDTYTTVNDMPEIKINIGGTEMDASGQGGGPTTTVSKVTGEVVSVKSDQMDENAYRLAHLTSMRFPTTALKVGDTWTYEVKKDEKGSVDAKASYKVEAQEKMDGFETYKISGSFKESAGSTPASTEGTYWVNIADGTLVKSTTSMKNAPFPTVGPLDAKVTMTREK